jgi:hypothetical protein
MGRAVLREGRGHLGPARIVNTDEEDLGDGLGDAPPLSLGCGHQLFLGLSGNQDRKVRRDRGDRLEKVSGPARSAATLARENNPSYEQASSSMIAT